MNWDARIIVVCFTGALVLPGCATDGGDGDGASGSTSTADAGDGDGDFDPRCVQVADFQLECGLLPEEVYMGELQRCTGQADTFLDEVWDARLACTAGTCEEWPMCLGQVFIDTCATDMSGFAAVACARLLECEDDRLGETLEECQTNATNTYIGLFACLRPSVLEESATCVSELECGSLDPGYIECLPAS